CFANTLSIHAHINISGSGGNPTTATNHSEQEKRPCLRDARGFSFEIKLCHMENQLGWKKAIIKVLTTAKGPMHYTDIAEQIFEQKLRPEDSANPATTVASTI